jgi:DNA-binding transcriptional LysR family regulator
MNLAARFRSWLKWIVKGQRLESEMETEVRFHIESYAADLVRKGLSQQEAMRQSRIEFGGIESYKDAECYTTYPWFGRIAREFKAKCPNVELKLITGATARPLLELERGSIDVAITSSRTRNKKLWVQDLFSDELVAVVAKDHPWAEAKGIAIKEFRHIHLLAYSANPMDSDFVREILLPPGSCL